MLYLTGVSNSYTREAARTNLYGRLGVLLSAGTSGEPGCKANLAEHIPDYCAWGYDNGCYASEGAFDEAVWIKRLAEIVYTIDGAHDSCLFAVAPDVFNPAKMCGDPIATIERSLPVLEMIRSIGVPAALVYQDGLEDLEHLIPWDAFDVAFLGGGDDFKLGRPTVRNRNGSLDYNEASEKTLAWWRLMARTVEEGKEIHVGRVNTRVRMNYSWRLGAQSCDGTMVAFSGEKGVEQLGRWLPDYDVDVYESEANERVASAAALLAA